MKEQGIQSAIIKELTKQGYFTFKTIRCNKSGIPDIIACSPKGEFVGIEVKTPTGVVSKIQDYQIRKINENNGIAFIARSVEDIRNVLKF